MGLLLLTFLLGGAISALVLWMRMDDLNSTGHLQDLSEQGNDGNANRSAVVLAIVVRRENDRS